MNKQPNMDIGCTVASCSYHDGSKHCTLPAITVEACPSGSTGKAMDESMCGSYKNK